ncbi:hypothetical protein [Streptomyces sp. NPDC002889]|uniref:hypothetical protein n=1 Tax=Streptomyces sp. NPDC002889 TaxID=3364669 RepID=UPI0036BF590D
MGDRAQRQPQARSHSQPPAQWQARQSKEPSLDELLAAAARPVAGTPEAGERALAAFRAARDAGALDSPTRRRDDWRPRAPRLRAVWVKIGIGTVLGGVMLGGVAMASGAIPTPFGEPSTGQSTAPGTSSGTSSGPAQQSASAAPSMSTAPTAPADKGTWGERPPTAKDVLAHCRAYKNQQRHGAAADSGLRQRLEAEAGGGPEAVTAYCARLLEGRTPGSSPEPARSKPANGKKPPAPTAAPRKPTKH